MGEGPESSSSVSYGADSLRIASDAKVYSCFLESGKTVTYIFSDSYGGYLCVLEGGDIAANGQTLHHLDAAMIRQENDLAIEARSDTELLLVVVPLK